MRFVIAAAVALSLSACGSAYVTPEVKAEATAGGNVTVEPITAQTIAMANRSPYRPRTIPAFFSQTAGTTGSTPGTSNLPDATSLPEPRPAALETRLPPVHMPGAYRIGTGDVVLLATPAAGNTVEELSGLLAAQTRRQGYTVQDDGFITIPDIGRVRLAGLSLEEAEAQLFRLLVENHIDPSFSLEIAEFHSQRVSIGGAVPKPAVLPITLTPLYLSEAVNLAGGIAAANSNYVSIRLYRDGTIYQIPLESYLADASVQKVVLKDGDSLFVDNAFDLEAARAYFEEQITLAQFRQTEKTAALAQLNAEVALRRAELAEARANYQARIALDAVARDYVYLAGEVGVQARYTLPFERTANLADALFDQSGGVSVQTGNIAQIYVLRGSKTGGEIVAWQLDARNAANLVLATQFELRPNDIIFVAEQPVTRWGRVVQQLTPSLITTTIAAVTN